MQVKGDEIHETTEEARAGATPNVTRWVLTFGLLGAIALLTIIWVTGALSSDQHTQTVDAQVHAAQDANGSNTDSIVSDGADRMNATTPGESTDPQNTANKNAAQ